MKTFALLIAGFALAGSASAQAAKPNTGVYVGIEGGFANSTIPDTSGFNTTSETNNAGVLRGALGYQFTPNLALEAGYFSSGDFKKSGRNGAATYDTKVSAKGADLAVIYKFTEGVPGLFLKGGVTYAKVSYSSEQRVGTVPVAKQNGSQTGTGYLFGLGYEYDFSPNWSANVAYTRLQDLGGSSDAGSNSANVVTAGLKYRF